MSCPSQAACCALQTHLPVSMQQTHQILMTNKRHALSKSRCLLCVCSCCSCSAWRRACNALCASGQTSGHANAGVGDVEGAARKVARQVVVPGPRREGRPALEAGHLYQQWAQHSGCVAERTGSEPMRERQRTWASARERWTRAPQDNKTTGAPCQCTQEHQGPLGWRYAVKGVQMGPGTRQCMRTWDPKMLSLLGMVRGLNTLSTSCSRHSRQWRAFEQAWLYALLSCTHCGNTSCTLSVLYRPGPGVLSELGTVMEARPASDPKAARRYARGCAGSTVRQPAWTRERAWRLGKVR